MKRAATTLAKDNWADLNREHSDLQLADYVFGTRSGNAYGRRNVLRELRRVRSTFSCYIVYSCSPAASRASLGSR